ncbi:uncharacterized protein LOC116013732 [Ipomoea triloba]|uniref:uncharacterized protein LOC116013732 n=1 Tax=Ipomoea triloba TaxID=35885 RepID=UPI00125D34EE|nr:uncharacterized protein LOC116013732 [Ipomoea triloba]
MFWLRVETSSSWSKQTAMAATTQMIFFLMLFLCSCSSASSLTRTSPSGTIWEKSKLSGGGRGGMSNGGGQSGQPDGGSTNQNPHGSSAVIPIYAAANSHHNTHRNAAADNSPTAIIPPLFSATLLAFLL